VTAQAAKLDLDADPLLLLPPGAMAVASIDTKTLFGSAQLGSSLSELSDGLVPLGADSGFLPSRDVTSVEAAFYATGDGVTVLQGTFDRARIEATVATKDGKPVTHSTYAGHATSTFERVGFVVLTPHTAVAATGDGLRRVLDRVAAIEAHGKPEPSLTPWMIQALATQLDRWHPAVSAVADLGTDPTAAATVATLKIPGVDGLQRATAQAAVEDHAGLQVHARMTYADPTKAEQAASSVRSATRWLRVLGPFLGGIDLKGLDVASEANDTRCTFAVDDHTLTNLLSLASRLHP
jgi:hypothetical protein